MKPLRELKLSYPDAEYDEDTDRIIIYDRHDDVIPLVEYASADIYDHYEGYEVETNTFDPAEAQTEQLSGRIAVEKEFGSLTEAFKAI